MNIDEARAFLLTVMTEDFRDKTFTEYISNGLAGDFAAEIAAVMRDQDHMVESQQREIERLKSERNQLFSLERSYTHQLGEISRLSDKVCEWVRSRHADPPSEVWETADEIMQYVESVRPPEGSKAPEWVVHILGPDDVHHCIGEFDALRRANQHNKQFAKLMADDPSPNSPYCVALAKNKASEPV